jgi:hypothetical protein
MRTFNTTFVRNPVIWVAILSSVLAAGVVAADQPASKDVNPRFVVFEDFMRDT